MKKTVSGLFCLILLLQTTACGKQSRRFTETWFDLFDTVVTVTACDDSPAAFKAHCEAFHSQLQIYHRLFDRYHPYAGTVNIFTLNKEAKNGPVAVDDSLFELLSFGKESYRTTKGKVNICMGAVLSIWHDYRDAGAEDPAGAVLPPEAQLKEAAAHVSIDALELDATKKTVFFTDPLLQLDVGAIAKGFAAQHVGAWANQTLWDAAVLNLGGNVVAFGVNPNNGGGKWNVGIENPDETQTDLLATVSVTDCAVVTSGDYQRYYVVDGVRYCHIIDPETLFPARLNSSVTVLCADSAMADALSTALFLLPEKEGLALVEALPDTEALWVKPDGTLRRSSGFDTYLKNT